MLPPTAPPRHRLPLQAAARKRAHSPARTSSSSVPARIPQQVVSVEVHSAPSSSRRSPVPAAPFVPHPAPQPSFDIIEEAPIPEVIDAGSRESEDDPVQLLHSKDPLVLQQQHLLWEEAKARSLQKDPISFTPPLPSDSPPVTPSPPRDPEPSSQSRRAAPSSGYKYWPDQLPPPSTAQDLPGLYRAGEVPLPMFLWGLRFKDAEEALRSLGLPTDKIEEPPSKRSRKEEPSPSRADSLKSAPSSASSLPSVYLASTSRPAPSDSGNQDLLDRLIGPEPPQPPREHQEPAPPFSRETINNIIRFKPVLEAIKGHFPHADFPPLRQPRPEMGFEETLRSGSREDIISSAESSLLPTYKRMREIIEAMDKKVVEATERGQGAFSHLRTCRPMYHVFKDSYFSSSAQLNEDFKKLVRHPRASKSSISLSMEEFSKLEKVLQGLQETQLYVGWMLDVLSKEIRRTEFQPVDVNLWNSINRFLGSSMAETMSLSSSLFAFFRLRRREHFARDLPTSLSENERKSLLSSSLSLDKLFDNQLLLDLADRTTSEASKSAHLEMARTLPKLTSAVVSASAPKKTSKPSYQPSFRRDRVSSSSRRGREAASSSRSERDRSSRSRVQFRGAPARGRANTRGSSSSRRGGSRDKPQPPKQPFMK